MKEENSDFFLIAAGEGRKATGLSPHCILILSWGITKISFLEPVSRTEKGSLAKRVIGTWDLHLFME